MVTQTRYPDAISHPLYYRSQSIWDALSSGPMRLSAIEDITGLSSVDCLLICQRLKLDGLIHLNTDTQWERRHLLD